MEGFDIVLIQSLLAVAEFQRNFGEQLPDGSYQVTAAWQAGFTNGAIVGELIGLMLVSNITEKMLGLQSRGASLAFSRDVRHCKLTLEGKFTMPSSLREPSDKSKPNNLFPSNSDSAVLNTNPDVYRTASSQTNLGSRRP